MPVNVINLIKSYLTPEHIVRRITKQNPVTTVIRDWMYGNRRRHPMSQIALSEVSKVVKNVPVVRRGTPAYKLGGDANSITMIEPQPIEVEDGFSAKDINDLRNLGNTSVEIMVNNKTDFMMKTCTITSEALCAQSLTGIISYPMKTEGGMDTYEIDYGQTQTFSPDKLFDANDITIKDVYECLSGMQEKLSEKGFAGTVEFKAGKKVYSALLNIADSANNKAIKAKVEDGYVVIGGIKVMREVGTYVGVGGVPVKKVDDKKIVAVDIEAGHGFWWLALDDIEAGLQPLPFFPSQELIKNPSRMNIYGRSKPFPAPIVDAICWATVTS